MQQTMLHQWVYYTIQYLEPNTKSKGDGNHQPLGSRRYNKWLGSLKVKTFPSSNITVHQNAFNLVLYT